MKIILAREFDAHIESILRRELRDEPPHFPVAHNGQAQAHALLLPVVSNCLVIRA